IDVVRCRPEHIAAALEDLRWLGLSWEEPVLHQSRHFADYAAAVAGLTRMGVTYPCFATRAEIAKAAGGSGAVDPDGAAIYPGLYKGYDGEEAARRINSGEPYALRLDMDRAISLARVKLGGRPLTFTETGPDGDRRTIQARPERWGDAVIVRKDVPTSYHLSVVVDDTRQGITHVTRGMDLFVATDLHRLLQVLLDLPEPLYHHHHLLTDDTGRKLAKSAKDTSLRSLRLSGWTAADVRRAINR
ncbi:MAG: tRNA glutamyl-Q(34) synthetase GluQRS, partial [Hyphomicrobiaceae bacterium]